jgi:hypothetical protein
VSDNAEHRLGRAIRCDRHRAYFRFRHFGIDESEANGAHAHAQPAQGSTQTEQVCRHAGLTPMGALSFGRFPARCLTNSRRVLKEIFIPACARMCPPDAKGQGNFGVTQQKTSFPRGDKPTNNGDNQWNTCSANFLANFVSEGNSSVMVSRTSALLLAVIAGCFLQPWHAHAQWWGSRAPADFEECADSAEKVAAKEARTAALSECNAKFAGRRKPGGGYAYFDFMQNRNFDIAGPNPTPEEQKKIDEQYTAYLDSQRRSSIAAAFATKQQQLKQASLQNENEKTPPTTGSIAKPPAAAADVKHIKVTNCAQHSFSCDWPRLSESIKDLKKALFGSSTSKAKRS